ncbi:MAG: hypothetical protein LBV12_01310, partial [Puniceicoccales bacterium]|nr:hypothetical protein [Puniceicoccales bacterium]
ENLLGAAAEAIVIDDTTKIPSIVAALDEKNLGRAVLQVKVSQDPKTSRPQDPSLRPAVDVIRAKSSEHANYVAALLSGCYFADTLDAFLSFWKDNPSFDFILVATATGELIDRRGLIYGGRKAPKGKKETSFFQRENEIRQLKQTLTTENDRLTALNVSAMSIQQRMDENEVDTEERRRRVATLSEELSALQAEERSARQILASNDDAITRQQKQVDELETSQALALERMEKARAGLTEKETEIESRRTGIADLEKQLEERRAAADTARDSLNEIRLELATKRQHLQMLDSALGSIRNELNDTRSRRDTRIQELDAMDSQIEEMTAQATTARARAAQLAETVLAAQQTLETDRERHSQLERQIEQTDASLRDERATLHENENQLKNCEVRLTEETSQCAFLSEKVRTDYQYDITTLDWKRQLWLADEEFETKINLDELNDDEEGDGSPKPRARKNRGDPTDEDLAAMDDTDWPPLVREISDLRDRINSMGALNLAAIEEYAELRERYNFLKTQSDDLWNSKNELTKAIDEINQTSQQLFNDTFEQIRKNFVFTFERLFNGGSSDLQLIAAEDPLDSGIEIIARPPGTKLRSISLLSGGQRTMTAVALLFAIYMVKPSPFCVLDELDAPLDDANVGRFTDIVREFTRYSQFLVVTHNKRTVSASDTIYGVTMQERGVTKLLSMRFNKDTGDTEEVQPDLPGIKPALVMAR